MTDEITVIIEEVEVPEITVTVEATGGGGEQGETGPAGPTGAAGAEGDEGDPGAAGAAGSAGATGATGPAGPTGPAGADSTVPGPTGATGATGAAGATGATGPAGADSTVPGPTGATGAAGAAGATGAAGPGVPTGGATGSALTKNTATDYDTGWTALGTAATVNTGTTSGTIPLLGASGVLDIGRLATGSADGTKYIRDDGTLVTPSGGSSSPFAGYNLGNNGLLWVAGRYYGATTMGSATTVAVTANRLYLTPINLPVARSIDRLSIYLSTAGTAGHLGRLGLYNAHATTGVPTTVLVDAGTVAMDGTIGAREATVSQSVSGLFWLAFTAQSGTVTMWGSFSTSTVVGSSVLTALANTFVVYKDTVVATSALPDMTGQTLSYAQTNTPAIVMRAA